MLTRYADWVRAWDRRIEREFMEYHREIGEVVIDTGNYLLKLWKTYTQ